MYFFIAVVFCIIGFFYWLGGGFKRENSSNESTRPSDKSSFEEVESHFHRIDGVQGILHVGKRQIKTYNVGRLSFDDIIGIKFYNQFNRPTRINDIYFKGQSLFAYAPAGISWREKVDYAITVLKQTAEQGGCKIELVSEIEEVVLELDEMNRLMEEGHIVQTDHETEDYEWIG
ncbi:hypothetical protein [Bacillus velezensis]|uniref:hypothetical protein n=1 Tax=Bacillus velezensis TaxID=492670 RepID=UPI001A9329F1|nr:hypothetical protein [Bacillus velezensis]BCT30309.1 hypothetical protein BVAD3_39830 [Bacillus velezensis]